MYAVNHAVNSGKLIKSQVFLNEKHAVNYAVNKIMAPDPLRGVWGQLTPGVLTLSRGAQGQVGYLG